MADILIKGMEMPIEGADCDIQSPFSESPYCRRLLRVIPLGGRLENCPFVEVPTHGRLIDADELKELFRETITGIATRTDMKGAYEHMIRASAMVIDLIDDAPTVIEASEDGEADGKL